MVAALCEVVEETVAADVVVLTPPSDADRAVAWAAVVVLIELNVELKDGS